MGKSGTGVNMQCLITSRLQFNGYLKYFSANV